MTSLFETKRASVQNHLSKFTELLAFNENSTKQNRSKKSAINVTRNINWEFFLV